MMYLLFLDVRRYVLWYANSTHMRARTVPTSGGKGDRGITFPLE